MQTKEEVWTIFNDAVKKRIEEKDYHLWLKSIQLLKLQDNSIILGVESDFKKEWILNNYLPIIRDVFLNIFGKPMEIILNVVHHNAEKNNFKNFVQTLKNVETDFYFNPEYTFEHLAVGNFNELAVSYAKHLTQNINDPLINPLFIYGGVGLGKTHIIQAIGNYFKNNPDVKVGYITMEGFLNDWVKAMNNNTMVAFKEKYTRLNILLVDDIQFIAGKKGLQEQFFHLFNELYNRGSSIVLTADKPIGEIKDVEERLVSRFQSGQSIEITIPSEMDRLSIIKKRMQDYNLQLKTDITNYMMEHINGNVRDIIAALKRISIRQKLIGRNLFLDEIKDILKDITQKKYINISIIMQETAKFFDIRLSELTSTKRTKNVLIPRQVAMYFMKKLLNLSYPSIANEFGGKDHTTVMNAVKKVEKLLQEDHNFKIKIEKLRSRF